ncbi:site-specific integrase [Flavobacterium columnare]|uniref:Site-specific integrase n=2 Tax=Flavobacterium columnare TaxID=996 RepID=A0AAI8GBN3_9FLAO|nr:site-specific integrase [Flavobacterium columnare]AMO20668.2 site-specific integrase [Flavobacterium columnare]
MNNFTTYFEKQGYSNKSLAIFQRAIGRLDIWMNNFGTTKETIDYKTFLKYIEELKKTGIKKNTLQSYIGNLKIYFNYLQEENYRSDNPIESINIKGKVKTVLGYLLTADELEDLYYSYQTKDNDLARKRNKIIIGLLVYQGLHTKELQHLKEEHIELYKGKIHIPQTNKTNGRTLDLKPWQLMELMEYIKEIRPKIVPKHEENLFTSSYGNTNISNVLKKLSDELKLINYNYQNAIQIRNSVIANYLKTNNLRKTQYFAGHRYISSTERYQQDNLEELHEMVNSFHPIK